MNEIVADTVAYILHNLEDIVTKNSLDSFFKTYNCASKQIKIDILNECLSTISQEIIDMEIMLEEENTQEKYYDIEEKIEELENKKEIFIDKISELE